MLGCLRLPISQINRWNSTLYPLSLVHVATVHTLMPSLSLWSRICHRTDHRCFVRSTHSTTGAKLSDRFWTYWLTAALYSALQTGRIVTQSFGMLPWCNKKTLFFDRSLRAQYCFVWLVYCSNRRARHRLVDWSSGYDISFTIAASRTLKPLWA